MIRWPDTLRHEIFGLLICSWAGHAPATIFASGRQMLDTVNDGVGKPVVYRYMCKRCGVIFGRDA